MSVIIIREVGAQKIKQSILEELRVKGDGWGITWYTNGKIYFIRNLGTREFIRTVRQREADDVKMIIHLNEFYSGDNSEKNLLPFHVFSDVGTITLNGWVDEYSPDIDPDFEDGKTEKSDEIVVAQMFKNYVAHYENVTALGNWNKFQITYKHYLRNMTMVIMFPDGNILNNKDEEGYYSDKGKLWFSEDLMGVNDNDLVIDNSLSMEEITEILDKNALLTIDNLSSISKSDMLYLMINYSYYMAEIIKEGRTGYESPSAYIPEDEIKQYMDQCKDCEEWTDKDDLEPFFYKGEKCYLCPECVRVNGIGAQGASG